ncbi:hypothetical protein ABEF95_003342 [Exophiala dermatitidis]
MPCFAYPQLDILAMPKPPYGVNVCPCESGECSKELHFGVKLYANSRIHDLKSLVRVERRIPTCDQIIEYNDRALKDDTAYLFEEGIFEDSTVAVTISTEITFHFKQTLKAVVFAQNGEFLDLLAEFAREALADLSTFCFVFVKTSGQVADRARDWASDRMQLFKAEQVVGTVKENGLIKGDEIQAYQMNPKRVRETADEEEPRGKS